VLEIDENQGDWIAPIIGSIAARVGAASRAEHGNVECSARVTRSALVRIAIASIVSVACGQARPAPQLSARVPADRAAPRVAIQPCPLDLTGEVEHELFAGCAPAPYVELISVCPRGECPKPCQVELQEKSCGPLRPCMESQRVSYDARGRFVKATQVADARTFQPESCSYDGDRIARCDISALVEIVTRDSDGRIATVSDGDPLAQFVPRYSWSGATVGGWDAGREGSTFEFDDVHRIVTREDRNRQDIQYTTYSYNAAGDLSEIRAPSAVTTINYDDRRRPVDLLAKADDWIVEHRKLAWDTEDRLVRDTMLAPDGTVTRVYTYSYACR
jgi:YD repeat-containing protein